MAHVTESETGSASVSKRTNDATGRRVSSGTHERKASKKRLANVSVSMAETAEAQTVADRQVFDEQGMDAVLEETDALPDEVAQEIYEYLASS